MTSMDVHNSYKESTIYTDAISLKDSSVEGFCPVSLTTNAYDH